MKLRLMLTAVTAAFAGQALVAPVLADMTVDTAAGRVMVKIDAPRVVAWKPTADGVAVLAEGGGRVDILSLPQGWQGDLVEQGGMYGVFLRGKAIGWNALKEGDTWLVREGAPFGKDTSALMLRDGWRVDGVRVTPREVELGGSFWQVGALGTPNSVAGTVVGMVKKGRMPAAVAAAVKEAAETAEITGREIVLKKPTVSTSNGMQPISVDRMLARLEPAAGKPQAALAPMAAPAGMVSAVAMTRTQGEVPVFPAEALRAVPSPFTGSEVLVKSYPVAQVSGPYVPGTVVSVTVPAEVIEHRVSATVMPMVEVQQEGMPEEEAALVESLFPVKGDSYTVGLAEATAAVVDAPTTSAEREARRALAGFYLAWERPEEAFVMTRMLPVRGDGLPADPVARIYMGLSQLAMGLAADVRLFDQKGPLARHGQMWRAVAASQSGDYAQALHEWPKERGILPEYPAYLREMAQVAQATALAMVGDRAVARQVADELAKQYAARGEVPAKLLRLQGLVRLGTPEGREGLEFLARAAENKSDMATAYRAKFEFVETLRQRSEISDQQVEAYLTELWLDWRGDSLERDVLGVLADLYERAGKPREALERWQTMVRAFPDIPDINLVTERMTQAFVDVFNPENPKTYEPLAYLGLYYDFRELVPNDTRGDLVQEQVARMLTDVTLWRRAEPLLEQQLTYRPLDTAAQARMVLLLAEVYRRQGKSAEALRLLDKWEKVASSANLASAWQLGQARALMDLKRYDSAKRAVARLGDNKEAQALRIEADWNMKNWQGVVAGLQQALAGVTPAALAEDGAAQLDVFKLAYAYGQLGDGAGLKVLKDRYAVALAKLPRLADDVNTVAAGTGIADVSGGGALAPVTRALADINTLTKTIGNVRVDREKARKEREDYNSKMRYMELLPPPVI